MLQNFPVHVKSVVLRLPLERPETPNKPPTQLNALADYIRQERKSPMNRRCNKCNHQSVAITSSNVFLHGVKAFSKLVKIEVDYTCPGCGQKTGEERVLTISEAHRIGLLGRLSALEGRVKHRQARLVGSSSDGRRHSSVQYPSAFRAGENILYPTFEGNVQDGTVIDQHGDPDLVLEFAEQYFSLFSKIMPMQRLPSSLIELMPALHLLVIATELALKAYLIRNDKVDFGHSLEQLYDNLDLAHRNEIEARFSKLDLNTNLVMLGLENPSVAAIFRSYDNTYGGESKVYMDTRYYAEPTTTFKPSSNLHGANLVKSHNPYPIFLPEIVSILFDTYRFFSGHERLGRLGGDVGYGTRDPGNDNHGDWGLVPSSLSLVVLSVPQPAGVSAEGDKLKAFKNLLTDSSPAFSTTWKYGGKTLLFYADGAKDYIDGRGMLNEVECRVWRHKRLGMHARDLNLLADVLESGATLGSLSDMPESSDDWTR